MSTDMKQLHDRCTELVTSGELIKLFLINLISDYSIYIPINWLSG